MLADRGRVFQLIILSNYSSHKSPCWSTSSVRLTSSQHNWHCSKGSNGLDSGITLTTKKTVLSSAAFSSLKLDVFGIFFFFNILCMVRFSCSAQGFWSVWTQRTQHMVLKLWRPHYNWNSLLSVDLFQCLTPVAGEL